MSNLPLSETIQPDHIESAETLRQRFDRADPFRHLVFENFLRPEFAERLLAEFPPFDRQRAMNENGEVGGKCVHEDLSTLSDPYQRVDRLIRSTEFLAWLGQVTGIDDLQYDPDYFGGGTHENRHGQDLDPHVDFNKHPKSGLHRRLNLIVYLNHEWSPDWGGAIEFHSDPRKPPSENRIELVQPAFNRAVLFETTHWSWHGFERIDLPDGDDDSRSRKSVALYFYTRERPERERTRPHSTIYVERPLPGHIRPGQVLSGEDYAIVQRLLGRRDQHLQRLYGNISELSAHVEDLIDQRDRAMRMVRPDADPDAPPPGFITRARRWLARRLMQ